LRFVLFAVFSHDTPEIAHRLLGTLPYRLLLPISRYDSLVSLPKAVGMVPLNLFPSRDNRVNDVNSPSAIGILPLNRLPPKSKYCKLTRSARVDSMIRFDMLLLWTLRYVNDLNRLKLDGNAPKR